MSVKEQRNPYSSTADASAVPDIELGHRAGDHSRHDSLSEAKESHNSARQDDSWLGPVDSWLTKLGIILTPSYLQRYVGGDPPQASNLHAIAALDGLRGWACLLVFNFHFFFTYTWRVAVGWGFHRDNFYIFQLPILHLLVSGHIMVAIFFVISGYVLSYKPLKLARSKSWDQGFITLASGAFRRGMRLYIPSLVGIALVFLAVRAGLYHYSHAVIREGHTIQGTNEQHPPLIASLYDQFWDWYLTVLTLMNPWDWSLYYNYYNPHLWTIPVEFRCSIVLFVTILATSRLRTTVRMTLVSCLLWFCVRWGRWDVVLFLAGMLMAEVDLINGTWEQRPKSSDHSNDKINNSSNDFQSIPLTPAGTTSKQFSLPKLYTPNWWTAIFIIGLYIGSSPNIGYKWTPGYAWLAKLTPYTYPEPHRFPQTIGAVLLVLAINHSPDIQRLFVNPVSQYLGRISYAFYIVHGPILHCLGYTIMPSIWGVVGKESDFGYCFGFLVGWVVCLVVSLWAADVFWRLVDAPSVKFARWVESKLVVNADK